MKIGFLACVWDYNDEFRSRVALKLSLRQDVAPCILWGGGITFIIPFIYGKLGQPMNEQIPNEKALP